MTSDLAIVIPAYKEAYFHQALQSLANQTSKNFTVYIGDDASPFDLKSIADHFSQDLNISYTKFEKNTGARNLVNQWKRCIALSKNEKWLWLFSDDDIADPSCVENFYKILDQNQDRFDVYRFNTCVIDKAIIPGAKIYWRYSGINISGSASGKKKTLGCKFNYINEVLFDYRIRKDSLAKQVLGSKRTEKLIQYLSAKHLNPLMINYHALYNQDRFYQADQQKPFRSFFKYLYHKYILKKSISIEEFRKKAVNPV